MDLDIVSGPWLDVVVSLSHLLLTVNSSLNFIIYCYKDEKFRSVFLLLVTNIWKKSDRSIITV